MVITIMMIANGKESQSQVVEHDSDNDAYIKDDCKRKGIRGSTSLLTTTKSADLAGQVVE